MPSIGRIPPQKKDPWSQYEDAPDHAGFDAFEDAPEDGSNPDPKLTDDQVNVNYEAPAGVRMEVGGLEKPQDRLAALRKHYPDAQPHGDDNFIMTNPDNGEVMLYNQPGWIPNMGDIAEAVPAIGEGIGAGIGGILGAAGGTAVAPGVGTVGLGMAGAGAGGAAGRDLVERGINYAYGNTDTRTLADYALDKAKDVAVNAAGEGAGMAVAKGASLALQPIKKMIAGKPADMAAATQLATDHAGANIPATVGTITQNRDALVREARIGQNPESRVAVVKQQGDDAMGTEFNRITSGIASATDPTATPLSKQGIGDVLKGKADDANKMLNSRRNDMYDELDKTVGDVRSAGATNTQTLLQRLNGEQKAFGASNKLNNNDSMQQVLAQTKAAAGDLKKGMTFRDAQDMRSQIGGVAFAKDTDPFLASRMKDLYKAVTDDMGETAKSAGNDAFDQWKAADQFNSSLYAKDGPKAGLKALSQAPSGQDAYKVITNGIKDGDKSLAATRQQIEAAGGGAQWDQMTGSYLNQIGLHPTQSGEMEFSPKKFFQQWNQVSPEAKDQMFAGTARQQYRDDLDRLARIAHARTDGAKVGGRMPSDGDTILNYISGGLVPLGKKVVNSNMDKLLTNPKVVQWFTKVPQAEMQKGGIESHIGVLRNIARESIKSATNDGQSVANAINTMLGSLKLKDTENQ